MSDFDLKPIIRMVKQSEEEYALFRTCRNKIFDLMSSIDEEVYIKYAAYSNTEGSDVKMSFDITLLCFALTTVVDTHLERFPKENRIKIAEQIINTINESYWCSLSKSLIN